MHEPDGIAESRTNFAAAAAWVVEVVDSVPRDAWRAPGLGEWDLLALVGHTSRALLTVETYLAAPAEFETVRSPEEYFVRVGALPGAAAATVRDRGVRAGAALGSDPALRFAELAAGALAAVREAGNPIIETIAGGMRLSAYLRTRAFELVVHGLDVQRAVASAGGAPASAPPPADVLGDALRLAGDLAARTGSGAQLLLALTGRTSLPEEYSLLAAAPRTSETSAQRAEAGELRGDA